MLHAAPTRRARSSLPSVPVPAGPHLPAGSSSSVVIGRCGGGKDAGNRIGIARKPSFTLTICLFYVARVSISTVMGFNLIGVQTEKNAII
jgi:hypothetical protein